MSVSTKQIISRLEAIYAQIPSFDTCQHCHSCCGPIIWFKPEEIMMRQYMKDHHIAYIQWSDAEFKAHKMQCPYLKNDRCRIYPVRPIVCRLQGTVAALPCVYATPPRLSEQQLRCIRQAFMQLVSEVSDVSDIYSTRKFYRNLFFTKLSTAQLM